jgi:hypothetical protein
MTEAPDVYPEFPDDDAAEADDEGVEGRLGGDAEGTSVRTGDPRVDEVLASLEGLEERPVGEHAEVFSQAHEQLRAALDPDRESA